MSLKRSLKIPEYRYNDLKILINFTIEQRNILVEELKKITPATLELLPDICSFISNKLGISEAQFEDIFDFLLELYYIYYMDELELSLNEFLEDFQSALLNSGEESLISEIKDWDSFKKFLNSILQLDENIGIIAKSKYLALDHSNIYQRSRIYTDIRPIFTRDIEKIKPTALIYHNLKISYIKKARGDYIFLVLDYKDLVELKKIIERAMKKEKGLQSFLKEKNINYIIKELE